jgi:hypothetical protein
MAYGSLLLEGQHVARVLIALLVAYAVLVTVFVLVGFFTEGPSGDPRVERLVP